MKVWIVTAAIDVYERRLIEGVYSTAEKALEKKEQLEKESSDLVWVNGYEVQ